MSDSDSDGDLLLSGAPTFTRTTRQERAAEKSRETTLAFVDDFLQDERKRQALNDNIVKIKQEHQECDEERLTQAENISKKSTAPKRKLKLDSAICAEGLAELALRDQLTTALDTAKTTNLGTRTVLGRGNDEDRWSTVDFCLEELSDIMKRLQAQKGSDRKAFRGAIVSLLQKSIKEGTLEQLLVRRRLAKLCQKHNAMYLPRDLTEWLFCLASNPIDEASDELSTGAFQTLLTIFSRAKGTPAKPLLTLDDMILDMKVWFALRLDGAHSSAIEEKENSCQDVSAVTSVCVAGLENFLLLWERAFLNDIVTWSTAEAAKQCVVALARAALDPCFCKCQGYVAVLVDSCITCLLLSNTSISTDCGRRCSAESMRSCPLLPAKLCRIRITFQIGSHSQ